MSAIVNTLIEVAAKQGMSQKELAKQAHMTEENLSRMKRRGGNLDSIERIATVLGYSIAAVKQSPFPRLDHGLSVWSAPSKKNDRAMLYARLANASFKDLLMLADLHGIDTVEESLEMIRPEIKEARYRLQKDMLNNIKAAYA